MKKMGYHFQKIAVPKGVHLGGFRSVYEEMKIYMNSKSYRKDRSLVKSYYIALQSA